MNGKRRRAAVLLALCLPAARVAAAEASTNAVKTREAAMTQAAENDGRHDFDFLHGAFTVHNRRLKERLAGSTEWVEFEATNVGRPLLGGIANEDEYRTEFWPGFVGMAFRFFDPKTKLWAIYWADGRRGLLEPPVYGRFEGDRGRFEGDDTHEGRPVRVRFLWTGVRGPNPRWEQAFSVDGGTTWETNWIMDFTRDARRTEAR